MSTTLWQKFQAALGWLSGTNTAGIRTIGGSPYTASPFDLLDTEAFTVAPPTLATHGANVIGIKTTNLTYIHDTTTAENVSTVTIWLYNGRDWLPYKDVECTGHKGVLDPIDLEGFHRIFASVHVDDIASSGDATNLTLSITPHTEE